MTLDRERLAKLLGMVGSCHDGEALNAARAADALVRQADCTWFDIVQPPALTPLRQHRAPTETGARIAWCLEHRHLLTDWEIKFLASVDSRPRLTPKQLAVVDRLARKIEVCS